MTDINIVTDINDEGFGVVFRQFIQTELPGHLNHHVE